MSLIDCVIDESNIYQAIHTLKSNKGSKTSGVNGEIISDILKIEDEIVKRIKYDLKLLTWGYPSTTYYHGFIRTVPQVNNFKIVLI